MMNRELLELRSNEIAMECLHDIAMDLPAGERSQYVNIVTEAMINNPDTQLKILSKLSKQVDGLQQIDLEQCAKSAGNITKYPYYDALAKAIEIINESEVTGDLPNVIRMNKIHNILLDNADDFIWGYKHNDMVITKTYTIMTRLLFIMIDLSISDYVKALEINFKFGSKIDRTPIKVARVIKDADNMIKIFEKGDWRAIVNSSKRSATNRSMRALDEMEGTEPPTSMANEAFDINKLPFVNKSGKTTTVTLPKDKDEAAKGILSSTPVKVVFVIIVIMLVYRSVAFFVGALGGKFANVFRHCAELIKAHDAASRDQSESAVERHNKVYNRLIGIADRIDAFFGKASRESDVAIAKANKEDFNTAEITQINQIDFGV